MSENKDKITREEQLPEITEVTAQESPAEPEKTAKPEHDGEYTGMSKGKAAFLKILPMLIVLVCTGLFMWGIKFVIGIFYAPHDEVFTKRDGDVTYTIVKCYQNPSSYFYVYNSEEFTFNEADYDNVAGEHNDAHLLKVPEVYFVLNESAPGYGDHHGEAPCRGQRAEGLSVRGVHTLQARGAVRRIRATSRLHRERDLPQERSLCRAPAPQERRVEGLCNAL